MSSRPETVRVKPRQSLGQNFLVDENISRKIVRALKLQGDDVVLEIGAGQGALTQHLLKEVQKLLVVEIDARVVETLRKEFGTPVATILHEDFLAVSLEEWKNRTGTKLRLVGNIPYHLTSPILFKVFDEIAAVRDLTIMIQREVAHRLVAHPGTKDYGILAVFARYYGAVRTLFNVSPNCFYPKPDVTSTVIQFTPHTSRRSEVNETLLRLVVKTAFGKRRKTLRNSLQYLPLGKEQIEQLNAQSDVSLEKRPEQLDVEDFVHLARVLEHPTT